MQQSDTQYVYRIADYLGNEWHRHAARRSAVTIANLIALRGNIDMRIAQKRFMTTTVVITS